MSILHTLAPVRVGSVGLKSTKKFPLKKHNWFGDAVSWEPYSASPCAAGQHAGVLTARDLPCGGSLKGILPAQEVTGTTARVEPIRYLDAGAMAHPRAHMSCVHYDREGVAMHFAHFTYERHMRSGHRFAVVPYTPPRFSASYCRLTKYSLELHARMINVAHKEKTLEQVQGAFSESRILCLRARTAPRRRRR
ncbi:hypothetical protein EVAR_16854_1 [Eumeta japonica]|uniref:Uncharacterized protein n=1 Tax=Eumeta variegata TaxID=151549 RepID=A0A4C1V1M9_EUMVA|nr:hypothetical protein EVAR_16854_1 [Eumeta japonica]